MTGIGVEMLLEDIELCFSQAEGTPIIGRPLVDSLRSRIRKAKREIIICSCEYTSSTDFVLNKEVHSQLRNNRSVSVYGNSVQRLQELVDNFGRYGLKVFRWIPPRDSSLFHIKAVMIDNQWIYIGSANMSENAMRNSAEWGIIGQSPDMVKELKSYISELEDSGRFREMESDY